MRRKWREGEEKRRNEVKNINKKKKQELGGVQLRLINAANLFCSGAVKGGQNKILP